ncbi:MAG: transposase [Candidatus Thermoplasmatota archaeon]|nr:transposase [Candidatus Thermoplasmatota archaeon]MCL5963855.1 transposase [Candidatus Thermoplasmatota archaeon]
MDPKGTGQLCSRCGAVVKKDLSERIHICNNSGLEMDLNAALNIRERLHTGSVELCKKGCRCTDHYSNK